MASIQAGRQASFCLQGCETHTRVFTYSLLIAKQKRLSTSVPQVCQWNVLQLPLLATQYVARYLGLSGGNAGDMLVLSLWSTSSLG